ncbi:MAG: RNase adapter RapZ [Deltaproteobacteria bacterium]|nr:RNase adapter RapZ [Deltaproteobacteria bacterium]
MRLVVLSGPSGSGKSTAIKALEDSGFFCVDNMPVALLPKFMELLNQSGETTKAAAVVDVRERKFLNEFTPVIGALKDAGYLVELVYLEAGDETLVRRFSETRRRHPLAGAESPLDGVIKERELLKEVKAHADKVVDTSGFNVHELRELIKDYFSGPAAEQKMTVTVVSFGFRFGIPTEADIIVDIRFLPNPYFVDTLKGLDGSAPEVRDYVLASHETREFLKRFGDFLTYLVPLYRKEGKSYLTIAVGCTGGRHRSVVVVDALANELQMAAVTVRIKHRDMHTT